MIVLYVGYFITDLFIPRIPQRARGGWWQSELAFRCSMILGSAFPIVNPWALDGKAQDS
jgi:hypothetical protein